MSIETGGEEMTVLPVLYNCGMKNDDRGDDGMSRKMGLPRTLLSVYKYHSTEASVKYNTIPTPTW